MTGILFDSTGTASSGVWSANTAISVPHSVNSADSTSLYAMFFVDKTATLSGVTCDGTAMTLVTSLTLPGGNSGDASISVYKAQNVTAGVHTVSATCDTTCEYIAETIAYTNVASESIPQTATGTSSQNPIPSLTWIHTPGNPGTLSLMLVGGVSANLSGTLTPSGAVSRFALGAVQNSTAAIFEDSASSVPTTSPFTWNVQSSTGGTANWGAIRLEMVPVGGVSTVWPAVAPLATQPAVAPTGPAIPFVTKLQNNESVTLLDSGDSTSWGYIGYVVQDADFGYPGRQAVLLGQMYDANVIVTTMTYSANWAYANPVGMYSSSRGPAAPTIYCFNGAMPGAVIANYLAEFSNIFVSGTTGYLGGDPDLIRIGDGFNESSTSTFATNYQSYISQIRAKYPNTPIIVTTQNDVQNGTEPTGTGLTGYPTFAEVYAALLGVFLPGESLPLSPPLQPSTTYTNLWVLDSQQCILASSDMTDPGVHPNPTGYQLIAEWMMGQLLPPPATGVASGSYGWTYDTPITPYSHLPWQAPFTLGGPAGKASGAYAFTAGAVGEATHSGAASGAYSWYAAAAGNNGNVRGTTLPWTLPVTIGTTNSSSASGNYSWSGTAAGISPHAGNGTGTYIFAGNATGSTTHNGAASGTYSWYAAAAGNSTHSGKATGTYVFNGNAKGDATHSGDAGGTYSFTGSAQGHATRNGVAGGIYAWHATAAGSVTRDGKAAGFYRWSGSAAGLAPLVGSGSATGRFSWVGNVIGHATHSGAASGNYSWHAAAAGNSTHSGKATGTYVFNGNATGLAPLVDSGSATGRFSWVGNVIGHATHSGAASGNYSWHTAAVGSTTKHGSATGVIGWVGSAIGLAPTVSGHTIGHFAWVADAQGVTTKHGAASGVYGWVGSAKGPTSAPPHAAWTVVVSPESRSVVV